ncbi:hypothetical protein [Schaalia sp. 19OD2882]|uniref:hypothetical protein n=1 Tax=Schaalia sp. 19OD2882 TaxID=2794089 RepID=UPI0020A73C88|nr:hypothetical protein [Schaalia sp. 19OD2882]
MRTHTRALTFLTLLTLTLAGCGAAGEGPASGADPTDAGASAPQSETSSVHGHGHIDGATELEEPKAGLVTLDKASAVNLVDLETLAPTPIADAAGATHAATDGRFVLLGAAQGTSTLVDSGTWTWDHGDHQHFYRAPSRDLGPVDVSGPATMASTTSRAVIAAGTKALVLDRDALGSGQVKTLGTFTIDAGAWAGPLAGHVVTVQGGKAVVLGEDGAATTASAIACPSPKGGAFTRAGLVLGCEGGVVLASEDSAAKEGTPPSLEWLPLPAGATATDSPTVFMTRPRRPLLAALSPNGRLWLLDARKKTWTELASSSAIIAATTLDDRHDTTVGVDGDGRVHVWSDAKEATVTDPVVDTGLVTVSGIHVSSNRAYLPAAGGASIIEIDPADEARLARTIPTGALTTFQEVGL